MGWSSKYKSQGKSNTSPGKHHTDHTLLQCFISLIVLLYSHSCSKLQKKRTPSIWEKGVQLRKLGQSHQANSRLSRHTDTFSIAYHRCSLHWKWVFVARQRNISTCFFCETHGPTIPPWCFLEEKSGFGFHFWRHEIHPLRISGVSPTKNPRIGASRSRRSAGVSRVVFALVCLNITQTSEGKQPIKSNMQISRSLWHMGHEQCKMILGSILFGTGFHMFHITSPQGSELSQSGRAPPPFRFWVSQLRWEHQVRKLFLKVLVTPKEFHWKIQLKTTKLKGNQPLTTKRQTISKKISNIHKNHQWLFKNISNIHVKKSWRGYQKESPLRLWGLISWASGEPAGSKQGCARVDQLPMGMRKSHL